jgi:excisionase family DNA binding protein
VYRFSGLELETAPLMTIAELGAWLNISRGQVYRLMEQGLPYYRLGDRRFEREAVLAWLEDRKVAAVG